MARQSKVVSGFINPSSTYMGLLNEFMDDLLHERLKFVKSGVTRCDIHHAVLHRIGELQPASRVFVDKHSTDEALLATKNGAEIVHQLPMRRFWEQTAATETLLLSQAKELGQTEKWTSNVLDMGASVEKTTRTTGTQVGAVCKGCLPMPG